MVNKCCDQENRYAIYLVFFLILNFIICGGYYEFFAAISACFLAIFLIFSFPGERNKLSTSVLYSFLLLFFYLIASFYATDSGMAVTGVIKKSAVFLFALALTRISQDKRRKLLNRMPEIAVGITIFSCFLACIPFLNKYIIMAGRFAGTFAYANTYALFLLLSLLVLFERQEENKKIYTGIIALILLIAMWFSGSRYTWVLSFCVLIFYGFYKKRERIFAAFLSVFCLATLFAGVFLRNTESVGRLFNTNLSSLYGRLLYWQDALTLVKKHPFGMGYLGYFYEQTAVQTGVYTVRYVHNDWLQLILDIGIIPAVLLIIVLLWTMRSKKSLFIEKMLLIVISIHSFFEFDLEHNAIAYILILVMSCIDENIVLKKIETVREKGRIITEKCLLVMALCIFGYFSFPLTLYAAGQTYAAANLYPLYTDALTANMSLESDAAQADKMADRILELNDTVYLAYSAKAQVAGLQGDFERMCNYKIEAIRRNKYDAAAYEEYFIMLYEFLDDPDKVNIVSQEEILSRMKELTDLIEQNKNTVSPLGKRIDDKVTIDLPQDVYTWLSVYLS